MRRFTLIELLAVVAILAVLAALLLPALGRARDTARQVVCMSNKREIGIALEGWKGDHDNWNLWYQRHDGTKAEHPNPNANITWGCWPCSQYWSTFLVGFGYITGTGTAWNGYPYTMSIARGSVFDCPGSDGARTGVPAWAGYSAYIDPSLSQSQYDYGYLGAMGQARAKRCYTTDALPAGAMVISRTACQHGGPGVCPFGDQTGYNWVYQHDMKKASDEFFYKPASGNPALLGPASTPILVDKFVGRCACHGTSSHCVSYVVLDRWQCTQMHPVNAGYYHPGGCPILYADSHVAMVARLRPEDVRDTYWP